MITLLNDKSVCGSKYETAAWAVYFLAKGGEGMCEAIVRKIFSARMAEGILDVDVDEIDRKNILDNMLMTAVSSHSHILTETLMSEAVKNEVEFWLNQEDCFHIVEEDYDSVAIIAGYFSMENPVNGIRAALNMIK